MDPITSCSRDEAAAPAAAAGCSFFSRPNNTDTLQQAPTAHHSPETTAVHGREGSSTSSSSSACADVVPLQPVASPSAAEPCPSSQLPPKTLATVSLDIADGTPCPHDPELLLQSMEHARGAFDIITGRPPGSGRPKQPSADLESGSVTGGAEVCWICMCGAEEGELLHPCACPSMYSHQMCLVRWQMRQHGREEEMICRFCKGALPPWELTLEELRNKRAAAMRPASKRSVYYALACLCCVVCLIVLTVTLCFLKFSRRI